MSWATDILSVMKGDASINAATAGIYYEHLPDDADITNDYIVFTYNTDEIIDTLGEKDTLRIYELNVIVISQSPNTREYLTELLISYLENKAEGGISEISFLSDIRMKELDENIYINTMDYQCFYE